MTEKLEEYKVKKNSWFRVIYDISKMTMDKYRIEDIDIFWDAMLETDYKMIQEKIPDMHPLIFQITHSFDDEEIVDVIRELQNVVLNHLSSEIKKDDLSCYAIMTDIGAGKQILRVKFDDIKLENDFQKSMKKAIQKKFNYTLQDEVYESFWYIKKDDSSLFFPKFIEDDQDPEYQDISDDLRVLAIRTFGCEKDDVVRNSIMKQVKEKVYETIKPAKLMGYEEILSMISKDRMKYKTEWEDLGCAIFNITQGSEEGLKKWVEFSGYPEEECDRMWTEFIGAKIPMFYTIKTLKYWASIDNEKKYAQYVANISKCNALDCLKSTSSFTDYAKFIISLIDLKFLCFFEKKKSDTVWYFFHNHRMTECKDDAELRDFISEEAVKVFENMLDEIRENMKLVYDHMRKSEDKKVKKADMEEIEKLEARSKKCERLCVLMKTPQGKSSIIQEIVDKKIIRDDTFPIKRNKNHYKWHFTNGIYNFKYDEFVAGKPEDFITKSTNRPYRRNEKAILFAKDFLGKMFPNDNIRGAFEDGMAASIVWGNPNKLLMVLIGETGDNGKTTITGAMKRFGGDYTCDVGNNLLTSPMPKMGGHCTELGDLEDIPMAIHGETNVGEKLNSKLTKTISSGGDVIKIRLPYGKKMKEIIAGTVLWVHSNFCLEFDGMKEFVLSNRIIYIPCTSRFTKKAPDNIEEQYKQNHFKVDKDFSKNINLLVDGLTSIIFDRFKKYRENNFKIDFPKEVEQVTVEYRERVDIMVQYMQSHIRKDDDCEFTLKEIYSSFKNWYISSSRSIKDIPTDQTIRDWLNKKLHKSEMEDGVSCDKWKGYKILP